MHQHRKAVHYRCCCFSFSSLGFLCLLVSLASVSVVRGLSLRLRCRSSLRLSLPFCPALLRLLLSAALSAPTPSCCPLFRVVLFLVFPCLPRSLAPVSAPVLSPLFPRSLLLFALAPRSVGGLAVVVLFLSVSVLPPAPSLSFGFSLGLSRRLLCVSFLLLVLAVHSLPAALRLGLVSPSLFSALVSLLRACRVLAAARGRLFLFLFVLPLVGFRVERSVSQKWSRARYSKRGHGIARGRYSLLLHFFHSALKTHRSTQQAIANAL